MVAGKKLSGKGMSVINPNAAGIDIGSERHYVAVGEGRGESAVRSFGCYTADVREMAQWLMDCGVKTVAMESTGVYWIPVHQTLQEHGLEVKLVDARLRRELSRTASEERAWAEDGRIGLPVDTAVAQLWAIEGLFSP